MEDGCRWTKLWHSMTAYLIAFRSVNSSFGRNLSTNRESLGNLIIMVFHKVMPDSPEILVLIFSSSQVSANRRKTQWQTSKVTLKSGVLQPKTLEAGRMSWLLHLIKVRVLSTPTAGQRAFGLMKIIWLTQLVPFKKTSQITNSMIWSRICMQISRKGSISQIPVTSSNHLVAIWPLLMLSWTTRSWTRSLKFGKI